MSIAGAYLTSEGVVLGADSATVVQATSREGTKGVAQVFSYAQKVFEVGKQKQGRLGLCTWGSGTVGGTSHRTLVARLADAVEAEKLTVEGAAERLLALVEQERASDGDVGAVGYFLGGWDLGTRDPACYLLTVDAEGDTSKHALQIGEARFCGVPQFFTRVFHGYDPQLKTGLLKALKDKLGQKAPDHFDAIYEAAFAEAAVPLVAAGFKDVPLREAIDFIHTYLLVTVKATKFKYGPRVCGGPIEVAFISTDRMFRWVCHKGFDAAIGGT